MLAAAIGIDRLRKRNVGGIVARDDAFRVFDRDICFELRQILVDGCIPAVVERLARNLLEPPFRVDARAAAFARRCVFAVDCLQRHQRFRSDSRRSIAASAVCSRFPGACASSTAMAPSCL